MSLNKFMHPRNKYKKPPNFKALAIKYPEFRKYAKQDISGKISLNFKDLESVRALTTTLLKEDFNLDVEIPLSRLIPTLPLRLNYLLWIEDLLESNQRTSDIKGIDIGCGASCVYPLLGAKHFHWSMLATEVDVDSAFIASNNVKKNNLQDMITVRTVEEGTMLEGVVEPGVMYDFCMCNPPFFSSTDELDPKNVSRSPHRPQPRNAHSGMPGELVVSGGEIAFVTSIIQDSVKLKQVIRICSVMVGHQSSISKVKQALQEAGVSRVVTSEFCQGHTTRWGVAWTLDEAVTLTQVSNVPLSKKKKAPFAHTVDLDLSATVERLYQLLAELQITYSILKNNRELCAMEITAVSNTWANSRKKRRQEKMKEALTSDVNMKETKSEVNEETKSILSHSVQTEGAENKDIKCESNADLENTSKVSEEDNSEATAISKRVNGVNDQLTVNDGENTVTIKKEGNKRSWSENADGSDLNLSKRLKTENSSPEPNVSGKKEPLLHGSLVVKRSSQGSAIELCWLRGTGGRDSAHQVLQYLKNNIKTH